MGIKGLWDIIQPAQEQHRLTELAMEHGLQARDGAQVWRIGIDAPGWLCACTAAFARNGSLASVGENMALQTLFRRLARLAALPVVPIFIFDGTDKAPWKRGNKVSTKEPKLQQSFKDFIEAFGFCYATCPGESEAELAHMNEAGIIDAVITHDSDSFVFGAQTVLQWLNVSEKDDTVRVHHRRTISSHPAISLSSAGMILVAVLCQSDLSAGLTNCGPTTACGLAKYGLGEELLTAVQLQEGPRRTDAMNCWRNHLRSCLRDDPMKHIGRHNPAIADHVPDDFPDLGLVDAFVSPVTSSQDVMQGYRNLLPILPAPINVPRLTYLCDRKFSWSTLHAVVDGFRANVWSGILLRHILQDIANEQASTPHECDAAQASVYTIKSKVATRTAGKREHRIELNISPHVLAIQDTLISGPPFTSSQHEKPMIGNAPESVIIKVSSSLVDALQRLHDNHGGLSRLRKAASHEKSYVPVLALACDAAESSSGSPRASASALTGVRASSLPSPSPRLPLVAPSSLKVPDTSIAHVASAASAPVSPLMAQQLGKPAHAVEGQKTGETAGWSSLRDEDAPVDVDLTGPSPVLVPTELLGQVIDMTSL